MLKVFSLVFLTLQLASVVLAQNYMERNQYISRGGYLVSNNGHYALIMQHDGNLVIYNQWTGRAIWATNTGSGSYFIMQDDGNAVLYDRNHRALWATGTHNRGASYIIMQNDGNLVVYTARNAPVWASGTQGRGFSMSTDSKSFKMKYTAPPDEKTKTNLKLSPGKFLTQGQYIESENGKFRLVLQKDGFLAIVDSDIVDCDGKSPWRVGAGHGHKLKLEKNGNLVLLDVDNVAIWQSSTSGKDVDALVFNEHGNLVLIDKNNAVIWEAGIVQRRAKSYQTTTTTESTTTAEPAMDPTELQAEEE